ncbi:MAG TPA: hypothetical protein VNS58_14400 [Puia sp.]|nr:hypothetical protein [Puia sp.]
MTLDKCALIITSSVHVSARYTTLLDPRQREQQYLDSLSWFITDSPLIKIIVCDNSGYRYPSSLYELADAHLKQLELLSFNGNNALVQEYGKGYGEGEIMDFVMMHSLLLKEADGFLKVTGRLKVVNIAQVLRRSKAAENYFMPVSLLRPRFLVPRAARPCVEVRIYYVTKVFFRAVLLTAYKEVRDDNTFFLEHAYYQAIAATHFTVRCFPTVPEITGVSGSNGWVFKERSWPKKLLIKLVSYLGYVRPV